LSAIGQGVLLLVIGMAILFAAMGLLILVMVILERIFRTRRLVPEEGEPNATETDSKLARDTGDEEVAAAIAVALAHLRSLELDRSGLGAALEEGRGSWWLKGQLQRRPLHSSSRRREQL
jgi:sodium pump decarboxylase gamma subunit